MKTLQDYINESILDNEDEVLDKFDDKTNGSFGILVEALQKKLNLKQLLELFEKNPEVRRWTIDRFVYPQDVRIKLEKDVNGYPQLNIHFKGIRLPIMSLYYVSGEWILQIMNKDGYWSKGNILKTKMMSSKNAIIDELIENFGYKRRINMSWYNFSALKIK